MQKILYKHKPIVTYTILFLNVIVFIIELYIKKVYGNSFYEFFLEKYGISDFSIFNNHNLIISTFSSAFLHANFMHIAFNMLFLIELGPKIEEKIGSFDFFLLYLLGIVFSSLFSVLLFLGFFIHNTIIIGASGPLFALFAFFSLYFFGFKGFKGFLIFFILYHLLMIYLLKVNIAFSAHLGGSIAGIMYYFLFFYKNKQNQEEINS